MLEKPLLQVTHADLQALVGRASESKTLEFKRELAPGDKGTMTLLKSVSALANTAGGDLLIGVAAQDGIAQAIPGIEIANLDGEKLRLEQILRDCLEPCLPRLEIHPIALGDNRYVLAIRAAYSWIGPHRVTKDNNFYGRTSAGNYPLEVAELRTAFNLGESIANRIQTFRTGRLAKLAAQETPVPMDGAALVVLHMVPLPAIATRQSLDVVAALEGGTHFPLPLGSKYTANQSGVNLDGLYSAYPGINGAKGCVQIFRNGAIEGIYAMEAENGGAWIGEIATGNMLASAAKQYVGVLNDQDLGFPIYAMPSLIAPAGCQLRMPTEFGGGYYQRPLLHGPVVALPECVIDSVAADIPALLKPTLNVLANAFGSGKSCLYDGKGNFRGTG